MTATIPTPEDIRQPEGAVSLPAALGYASPSATLYLGDCREILPLLSGIEAIVSDPPYGIGFNYAAKRSRKTGLDWGRGGAEAEHDRNWSNILHDDEPFDPAHLLAYPEIVLWGANNYASKLPDSRGWLVWDKLGNIAPCAFGDVEIAWTNKNMSTRIHRQIWRGLVREGEENVSNGPKLHPAQKPVALLGWCIGFTDGQTICDPYMGCGTTGIAALRLRRKFIGIEKDPSHFAVAVERIKREESQGALL
jgi:site-specific DNA-methyltransferase (adenine-specific)